MVNNLSHYMGLTNIIFKALKLKDYRMYSVKQCFVMHSLGIKFLVYLMLLDTGIIFEGFNDIQKVLEFLNNNKKDGLKARKQIIKKFSKNRRAAQFKRVLKTY